MRHPEPACARERIAVKSPLAAWPARSPAAAEHLSTQTTQLHQEPMAIVVNKPLPEFEANATGGIKVTNTSHQGQVVVLYFYPKDNTPGCTTEAMQFRDKYKDFVKAGAVVFGVSRDNMKSHDDFKAKLELPFELIADTEEKMCHMFGVVKNKIMYGKKVKGIERSTFLVGADGILKQEWRGLKVPGHVDEVLKAVKLLKKAA
jgi:peroxiredoxin Q/BCP